MPEEPRLTSDVLRRNSTQECGQPIGQLQIKLTRSLNPFETVSFYCTKPKLHVDQCEFVGNELVVRRRRHG